MENRGHDESFVPKEKVQRVRALLGRVLPFVDPVVRIHSTPVMSQESPPNVWSSEQTSYHRSGRQTVRTILPEYVRSSVYVPTGEWPSIGQQIPDFALPIEEAEWKANVISQVEPPQIPPIAGREE